MSFEIELTDEASSDVDKHKKSGDKKVLIKIDKLFDELRTHPTTGTGKPESSNIIKLRLGPEEFLRSTEWFTESKMKKLLF